MAPQMKVLAAKFNDLSLVLRIYMERGEKCLLHACDGMFTPPVNKRNETLELS